MLSEERKKQICDYVNTQSAVTVQELMQRFSASEATIRRDLTELNKKGLLIKVHGGAVALQSQITVDYNVAERETVNRESKMNIARYAASLIQANDLVYIDAGTTTSLLVDYLDYGTYKDVIFVTNAIIHAKKLSAGGFTVYLTGGRLKAATEALIGAECYENLQKYQFSIGFFGTNAVSRTEGFTTPDPEEAEIKRTAICHTRSPYVLCDYEKFDKTSSVRFAEFKQVKVITDGKLPIGYQKEKNIIMSMQDDSRK